MSSCSCGPLCLVLSVALSTTLKMVWLYSQSLLYPFTITLNPKCLFRMRLRDTFVFPHMQINTWTIFHCVVFNRGESERMHVCVSPGEDLAAGSGIAQGRAGTAYMLIYWHDCCKQSWAQTTSEQTNISYIMCSHANMCFSACAQEYFVSVGGLESLSDTLTRVLSQSAHSAPVCKMATVITKTLSACISNNGKTHTHTPHENYWFVLDSPFLLSSCFRAVGIFFIKVEGHSRAVVSVVQPKHWPTRPARCGFDDWTPHGCLWWVFLGTRW